jgi:competence protein ComEC
VAAVEPGLAEAVPRRIRLRANAVDAEAAGRLAAAERGDRLRLRARLRAIEARANPGVRDRARALARRGIGAQATLVHPDLLVRRSDAGEVRPLAPLHRFRARAARRLAREGRGGALLAALALGKQEALDREAWDAVRALGLAHLLSVSGLHLVLVAAGLHALASRAQRRLPGSTRSPDPRPAALLAAGVGTLGYALLAGWGVPVRRSLWMLATIALSAMVRRPAARSAPLAAAALVILALEPAALFDPGAGMSFAATAALVAMARPRDDAPPAPVRRALRRLAELLASSAAAGAAAGVIAAASFGSGSPWSLAANLIAIPWTGLVLLPTALACALAAGLAPEAAWVGAALYAGSALGAASLATLEAVAGRLPALVFAPPSWPVLALAACTALWIVGTRRLGLRLVLASALPVGLWLAPPPAIDPPPPRVVVLDVGQGDAVLVQGRTGALLVDAGVAVPGGPDLGATVVVPALRALGVTRLDLLAASHGDLDHRGGLPAVLRAFPVARVWLPHGALADPAFAGVVATARAVGAVLEEQGASSTPLAAGDLHVAPLWPPPGDLTGSRNDRSLTLRIQVAGRTVLLPGDLETPAEHRLLASGAPLRADVLKLGHHGSRSSSSPAWLAAVGGGVAVASAPRFGRFGMPHREVVARTREGGYTLWWTGRDGAVLIGLEPVLHVRGWRE